MLHVFKIVQVSPQFSDELTENGTHLKNYNPRRRKTNKTNQPLQEVKELFPNKSNIDPQNCPKSLTRRNPLTFKQNSDQCFVQGAGRTHKLHSSSTAWCSQEISMYPSTCVPRSKLRSYDDESSDDSLTEGEDDGHVKCNKQPDDVCCSVCPSLSTDQNVHLDADARLDGIDDRTVPSLSQQDNMEDDNFADIRLRLSATTLYTEASNPTQCKGRQGEEDGCEPAKARSELIPYQDSHSYSHEASMHTPQSIHQQDKCSIYPKALADSATIAKSTCNNDGHISYPSVENLSELIKDMSVGDNIASNDHSLPVDNQNPSNYDHSMRLEHHECIHPLSCMSTSASRDRKLSKLDVTTFNPHSASTPFRNQHSQTADKTFNSESHNLSTAMCTTRVNVTPGHPANEEQEMSILVRETPEHLWCSPNLPSIENQSANCDSKQLFRVSGSIFHPTGLKSLCIDSNLAEPPPQHTSCGLSDIDMTMFNNFDNTDTSHTTMGDSHSDSITVSKCTCVDLHPTIPPTQDSTHSSEGEWSVLAKQTPHELWSSPVVRVVDDSLNST